MFLYNFASQGGPNTGEVPFETPLMISECAHLEVKPISSRSAIFCSPGHLSRLSLLTRQHSGHSLLLKCHFDLNWEELPMTKILPHSRSDSESVPQLWQTDERKWESKSICRGLFLIWRRAYAHCQAHIPQSKHTCTHAHTHSVVEASYLLIRPV